jgi:MbtH protein
MSGTQSNTQDTETSACQVLVNDEEQYSIWPIDKPAPAGWRRTHITGALAECKSKIDAVWLDMRPLSLRRR